MLRMLRWIQHSVRHVIFSRPGKKYESQDELNTPQGHDR